MQERRSTSGPQHATTGIWRSADEPPRALRRTRAAEYGLHMASGQTRCSVDLLPRQDFVRKLEPRGSFGSRRSLIVNCFPLDTLRAITTRQEIRGLSHCRIAYNLCLRRCLTASESTFETLRRRANA